MKEGLSRRQFLRGVGAAGVLATAGAASTGLVGCAPSDSEARNTAGQTLASGENELIAQAYLNPQDYDYRQNTTDFATLFSPVKIGNIESSHRIIKSAAGSATYLAGPSDEMLEYYVNMAKGGVEFIWIENVSWLEPGPHMFPTGVEEADGIAFGKKLVEECGKYGATLGYQWAPFGMPVDEESMSVEAIIASEETGVKLALFLKDMGFKALEINAAGFNQGEQFLSRFHNTRTDEYGGSVENRARYSVECIEKIKAACGEDFVIQMLIDCVEENDNLTNDATLATLDNMVTDPHNKATTIEEGIEFAKLFEAAGADSMHLRLGPLGNHPCQFGSDLYFILNGIEGATGYGTQWDFNRHWQGQLIGNHSGAGMLIDIVARYKEAVTIPCGTVTYMDPAHAPDMFEQALADGKVDFYLMNRPLTVDMDYVNKLREGRIDEIAPCTRCLHCHIGSNEMNRMMGYCRVNALTQRVMSEGGPATYEPEPAATSKKVMVIGGGPAGMEAARIAALRGHEVSLYEKNGTLGGQLEFASRIKGPHENLTDLAAYLAKQVEIAGVNVVLNTEVDAALVSSETPDAVILAVGGIREELGIAGSSVEVVDFNTFETAQMGDNVIVYGSNAQAFDCALWLTVHKKNVSIVTPHKNEELDMQQSQHAHRFMTTALYSLGVKAYPETSIEDIGDGQVTLSTGWGTQQVIPCDAIVAGAELLPNKALLDEISVSEVFAIGDCDAPFNIALAIRAGNDAGRAV